jgi:cyclopropane fatty-acyl-phospholipid synthase-like methyltransferase
MKGWLKVPGIRPDGDRTLAEQMLGLNRALAECKGKTVLDLGCAEGLIGLEFAKAGAARVVGIEVLDTHLDVAREACAGYQQMEFIGAHLGLWVDAHPEPEKFDIVLALGIIHKLEDPEIPLKWAALSARSLLCFRAPAYIEKSGRDYLVKAKHSDNRCNVPKTMRAAGFVDEGVIPGVRGESVQYWRRRA